jgi:hypothetical protein
MELCTYFSRPAFSEARNITKESIGIQINDQTPFFKRKTSSAGTTGFIAINWLVMTRF